MHNAPANHCDYLLFPRPLLKADTDDLNSIFIFLFSAQHVSTLRPWSRAGIDWKDFQQTTYSASKASQIYIFSRLLSHEKDFDFVVVVDLDVEADFDVKQFPIDKAHFPPLAVLIFAIPLLKSAFLAKLSKGYSACT